MDAPRPALAVLVTAVVVLLVAPHLVPSPAIEESTYGYSVSLATNATLSNVTLYFALPVSPNGSSPVVEAVDTGSADAPRAGGTMSSGSIPRPCSACVPTRCQQNVEPTETATRRINSA